MTLDYEPFMAAAREIAAERGDFALFVLALREEMTGVVSTSASDAPSTNRWDVILAAPWLLTDRRAPLEYVADKIKKHGGATALRSVARLSAIPVTDDLVVRITNRLRLEPLDAPPGIVGTSGAHLIEPSLVGPGILQAIVVVAQTNRKSPRK